MDFSGNHKNVLNYWEAINTEMLLFKTWKGIQRSDIHNTGGFTTGESAIGNPYAPGSNKRHVVTVCWIDIKLLK